MRTLISGNVSINVRANNLARLYYKQQFGVELDKALEKILRHASSDSNQNVILQLMQQGFDMGEIMKAQSVISKSDTIEEMEQGLIGLGVDWNELINSLTPSKYKTKYPSFECMEIIWAMAMAERKTQQGNQIPFEPWLAENADFDVNDCGEDFLGEVELGFFRYNSEKEEKSGGQHRPGRDDGVGNSGSKKNGAKS